MLLGRPVDARVVTSHRYSISQVRTLHNAPTRRYRCGRLLTGPLTGYVLLPLAAPRPAGRGWSHTGPHTGNLAWPSPGGGRGRHDHTGRVNYRMTNKPLPEVVPEEQDVHADHDGYQREHVYHDGCLPSHRFVLLRATEWSKSRAGGAEDTSLPREGVTVSACRRRSSLAIPPTGAKPG